jgi:hypothetical protein
MPQASKVMSGQVSTSTTSAHVTFPVTGRITKLILWNIDATDTIYVKLPVGFGNSADAAVTTSNTTLVDTRQKWVTNEWVGSVVTCNGKTMTVTSNDATTLTGGSWSGGGNPGNGYLYTVDVKALATNFVNTLVLYPQGTGNKYDRLELDVIPPHPGFTHIASANTPKLNWIALYEG